MFFRSKLTILLQFLPASNMIEENTLKEVMAYLTSELAKIRAGRASIDMVEKIPVDAYGAHMPLNQVATLSLPEARMIVIQPWDRSIMKDIESALRSHMTDINPVVDADTIRITFPAPTEERRKELVREAYKRVEEAKIKIRRIREDILQGLKKQKDEGEISEDEEFREKEELQKSVDEHNTQADEMGKRKEGDIMSG